MRTKRKEVHITQNKVRLVGLRCPRCSYPADAATGISMRPNPRTEPKPGDVSMCLNCASMLMYTEALQLRYVDRPERRKLVRESPRLAQALEIAQKSVAMFHERKKAEKAAWN